MSSHGKPPLRWRKSARCGPSQTCVEVARLDDGTVSVRDADAVGPQLSFTPEQWHRFVARAKGGHFDRA
ncbi:MAG TPA: DUF397 domain-containing protein [Spirillospora sp.]|nr:DUF397 domain-containing protein [Spirillospora sp.]